MRKIIEKFWLWWITSSKELSKYKIAKLMYTIDDAPIILEIGSYDGKDTQQLARIPYSSVICFEADERIYDSFNNRVGTVSNIFLKKLALGNVDGEVDFYLSDSDTRRHDNKNFWSASSSMKEPNFHLELFKDVYFKEKTKVKSEKLDTWYNEHIRPLDRNISFIWCDINGAEEDFILGGIDTLQNHTRYLYIEFSDKELYKGQITKDRILELLPNFELIGIYNFPKDLGNFGNLLLKNKTL